MLDPRPGLMFTVGAADPVVPDIIVTAAPRRGLGGRPQPGPLPKVLVDQTYHARIARRRARLPTGSFLADCLQSANWLTRSLDQRGPLHHQGGGRDRAAAVYASCAMAPAISSR